MDRFQFNFNRSIKHVYNGILFTKKIWNRYISGLLLFSGVSIEEEGQLSTSDQTE